MADILTKCFTKADTWHLLMRLAQLVSGTFSKKATSLKLKHEVEEDKNGVAPNKFLLKEVT